MLKNRIRPFVIALILSIVQFQISVAQYMMVPDLPLNLMSGTGTAITNLADDNFQGAFNIGFTFTFYGNNYTQFYVGSNGIMAFGSGKNGGYGSSLPTSGANNSICFANSDLNCSLGTPTINYFTSGTAPNRILVLNFFNVKHYSNSNNLTKIQVQLFETSNKIEIHSEMNESLGNSRTIGLQNSDGTAYCVTENSYNTLGNTLFHFNGTTTVNLNNRAVRFTICNAPPSPPSIAINGGETCASAPITTTLTASCTSTFKGWSNGSLANSITVNTSQTTLFSAFCESAGCMSYTTFAIQHYTNPSISPSTTQNICQGDYTYLYANIPVVAPIVYQAKWYRNGIVVQTGTNNSFFVDQAGVYKMSYSTNNCDFFSNETTVNVLSIPNPPSISVTDTTISGCNNNTLLVSGCTNGFNVYRNDGATNYLISSNNPFTITQKGIYSAKCIALNGCLSVVSNKITMSLPVVEIGKKGQIISGYFVKTCETISDSLEVFSTLNLNSYTFQWYKNNVFVRSGRKSIYDGYGIYKVKMMKNGTCVMAADSLNFSARTNFNIPTVQICDKPNPLSPLSIPPSVIWDKNYTGGSMTTVVEANGNSVLTGVDRLITMVVNDDDTYLLCGNSNSDIGNTKSRDRIGNTNADSDYWIVKVNKYGQVLWNKTFGGIYGETLAATKNTPDGGYVLVGASNSPQGFDISQNNIFQSSFDIWIVKIDSIGNKIWDKRLGASSSYSSVYDVVLTNDGGYLIGASSVAGVGASKSQPSKGSYDMWLIKIDALGNKVWDNVYGGNTTDYLTSITKTSDGYLLAGNTYSPISGDISQISRGSSDFWAVKIDETGNKMWDKRYGGSGYDYLLKSLKITGGYLLGGTTSSPVSGDKTALSGGANNVEMWVVKIDDTGNKIWDKTFGNGGTDKLVTLKYYNDSTYLVGGIYVNSNQTDYYVNKIDKNGIIQWEKLVGSYQDDDLAEVAITKDFGILLAGTTFGSVNNSNDRTQGAILYDYWMVKIAECSSFSSPYTITEGDFVRLKATSTTACAYDQIVWSNGGVGSIIEVNPTITTTYTARCYDPISLCSGNVSNELQIIVNCQTDKIFVNSQNNVANSSIISKASKSISTTNRINGSNSNVIYQAGEKILFLPGFNVEGVSSFKAQIGGCNN